MINDRKPKIDAIMAELETKCLRVANGVFVIMEKDKSTVTEAIAKYYQLKESK